MTPRERAQNDENARLRIALARAEADAVREREALTRQINELLAQLARQSAQLDHLARELARSNERFAELLAIANRKKRAPAKEKPEAPPAPPLDLSEAQSAAFSSRETPPEVPAKEKHPKKRSRNGPTALPEPLPVDEVRSAPEACTCGCTALEFAEEIVSERLHVVEKHMRRQRIVQVVERCKQCRRKVVGASPPAPCEQSKVSCAWLAWLVVQKFHLLVPLDRIRRDLALRGIPIAISTLVTAVERAAIRSGGPARRHRRGALATAPGGPVDADRRDAPEGDRAGRRGDAQRLPGGVPPSRDGRVPVRGQQRRGAGALQAGRLLRPVGRGRGEWVQRGLRAGARHRGRL